MIIDIVLGCTYGDEGKGKVVHSLMESNKYDLSVRFNGSCNAGHTVYKNQEKFVLHQLPVGILTENIFYKNKKRLEKDLKNLCYNIIN